jgi:hypothetical protein
MMGHEDERVMRLIEEYGSILRAAESSGAVGARAIEWREVEHSLQRDAAWTREGAKHVAVLARQYGAFVLRNALALSLALGIEDGEKGL